MKQKQQPHPVLMGVRVSPTGARMEVQSTVLQEVLVLMGPHVPTRLL